MRLTRSCAASLSCSPRSRADWRASTNTGDSNVLSIGAVCRTLWLTSFLAFAAIGATTPAGDVVPGPAWDNLSDTWVATDALSRTVSTAVEVGPPRADRTVALFYFLWLGEHAKSGPYDVSRILFQDPDAMRKPDSPLWGPLHAPHHWGESIFGYYRTRDEGVLRKHAQMLADAGVDVVIFDVTNQITYRDDYRALLRVWSAVRAAGNRTPQVAFLTPFWDPAKVVRELWRDLYSTGIHRDLWFSWDGKPLLLADPDLLDRRIDFAQQDTPEEITPGRSLGQSFNARQPFQAVGGRFPTWHTTNAAVTLSLRRSGPEGELVTSRRFENVGDNSWLLLNLTNALPAGAYYLEAAEAAGRVGWWSHRQDSASDQSKGMGRAMANRAPVNGGRTLRLVLVDGEAEAIRRFFTFRKPQPDYFQGPIRPDMWSWLEVYPQQVFRDARGAKEQMSVSVAQNAVGGRLGSMSEAGARGRSFHMGRTDRRDGAARFGFNFAEQARRALQEDPRFIFVTGWNEWIAGRFKEFNGVREPVMFVDQFDAEHSRDIEPMRGGHGDNYYYQLADFIRRYKGARALASVRPGAVQIDGQFNDWTPVTPEFRDTVGDPVRRDAIGWKTNVTYRNDTGRNDLVAAKVSFDAQALAFYVRTRDPLTPPGGTNWMVLLLDLDGNATNGWLGYDLLLNRAQPGSIERHAGPGFQWRETGAARWQATGSELELAVGWRELGLDRPPAGLDFKWTDHLRLNGDWSDFTLNGDVAPNDRFNYRARLLPGP